MLADIQPRQRTWPTLGWTGAGVLALILAQLLAVVVYVLGIRLKQTGRMLSTYNILHSGQAILAATILSTAALIPLLLCLTRMRTRNVAVYLAFCWPDHRKLAISAVGFVLFMAFQMLVLQHLEASNDLKFMHDLIASAHAVSDVTIVVVAIVFAAPIGEELVFRGFLYRTLELKFGGLTAIVVTALGWAALHIQYSLIGIVVIFSGGLLFGAIRRYSGSLYLTMLLHALWNGAGLLGTMLVMPRT